MVGNKNKFRTTIAGALILVLTFCSATGIVKTKAESSDILTSADIKINGFQINTDREGVAKNGAAFRVVSSAPENVTVNGKSYKVLEYGTSILRDDYAKDKNSSCVLLTETSATQDGVKYYSGNTQNNNKGAYGYVATKEKGILQSSENGETLYALTIMGNSDNTLALKFYVRAFVRAEASDGTQVFIYGQKTALMSIADIAYKVYYNGLANSSTAHQFIWDSILNKDTAKTYLTDKYASQPVKVAYGWNKNLYGSENTTVIDGENITLENSTDIEPATGNGDHAENYPGKETTTSTE